MPTRSGAPQVRREPGELFGPRFELFADVLGIGLATAVACLPLLTVPLALSTATALLRERSGDGRAATAGRYAAALRRRLGGGRWRSELAAGGVALVFVALLAADAALAGAGLPGATAFSVFLAAAGTVTAVIGLRSCARPPSHGTPAGDTYDCASADGTYDWTWPAAVRAGAARTAADLPGSALVLLAAATAAVCAWAMPPLLFLVPGPLALALAAVELRLEVA